ncbi:hypothetical protein [Haloferax sp. DFSO60]|uniref:hypothetical protein n=1 Tax=Haloferax sp. DFSO60 TaxID=3388652 RepID=UPI00397BEF39
MNGRNLQADLATLFAALWAIFGVYHIGMAMVTGISIRGFTFGTVGLGAFFLAIRFRARSSRLRRNVEARRELVFLTLVSLALILLSFTLLG